MFEASAERVGEEGGSHGAGISLLAREARDRLETFIFARRICRVCLAYDSRTLATDWR